MSDLVARARELLRCGCLPQARPGVAGTILAGALFSLSALAAFGIGYKVGHDNGMHRQLIEGPGVNAQRMIWRQHRTRT